MISKENQHTGSLDKLPEPAQLWSEGLGISVGQQASLHLLLLSTAGASPASASKSPAGHRVMDSRAHTHSRAQRTVRTQKQRETQCPPPCPRLPFCLFLHSSSLSDTPERPPRIFQLPPASSLGHGRGLCPPFPSDSDCSAAEGT